MNNNTSKTDRRTFLGQVSAAGAVSLASGVEPLFGTRQAEANAAQGSNQRANDCAKLRRDAAQAGLQSTPQNLQHPTNGDESLYPNKAGSYSKGLPHNADGTPQVAAFQSMIKALNSGNPSDFDGITMGSGRKLTNPQSGLAFDMQGPDGHALVQPPAPAFASKEEAAVAKK